MAGDIERVFVEQTPYGPLPFRVSGHCVTIAVSATSEYRVVVSGVPYQGRMDFIIGDDGAVIRRPIASGPHLYKAGSDAWKCESVMEWHVAWAVQDSLTPIAQRIYDEHRDVARAVWRAELDEEIAHEEDLVADLASTLQRARDSLAAMRQTRARL